MGWALCQTFILVGSGFIAAFCVEATAVLIDRLNTEGGILAAIDEVPKFIRRNTKMAGKFGTMQRRDISEYPAEGIREALTNALAHANYEVIGSRIFVAIYDNRQGHLMKIV